MQTAFLLTKHSREVTMAKEDSVRIYPMAILDRHYDESSVSTADTEIDDEVYNCFLDTEEGYNGKDQSHHRIPLPRKRCPE